MGASLLANGLSVAEGIEPVGVPNTFTLSQIAYPKKPALSGIQDGFGSSTANNETLFMVFEGPMLIIATLALTIFHPAYMFQGKYGDANWGRKSQSSKVESTEGSQFESIREVTKA